MNLALRHVLARQSFKLCDKIRYKPVVKEVFVTSNCYSYNNAQIRKYSEEAVDKSRKLPQLMEFPPIMWPSIIKFIKNWMFANFIIRPYFEPEFSLQEFIEASKHAVQVVSEALQNGDFKALEGIIEKDAIAALKKAVSNLSMSQRQLLGVQKEDIFYAFPYQIGVMFDNSEKRWVEITMCYHVMQGLKQLQESGDLPPVSLGIRPEYQERIFVLNYRFIREFTKGVEDSWWVNVVNHFQPHTIVKG